MPAGFLEGVDAEVVHRGIDSPLAVGVFVTPVHPLAQDVEAALRLVSVFGGVYGDDVDLAPLQEYAQKLDDYHAQLYERMKEQSDVRPGPVDDRMFI